jgi:hypothetical protein
MISTQFRETALTKFSNLKLGDEREEYLTGRATKATYLSTVALLIFLFCLSSFRVSVYRVPDAAKVAGKSGTVTLGFDFSLWEGARTDRAPQKEIDYFTYDGFPLSKSALILTLLCWQILFYHYAMRRAH